MKTFHLFLLVFIIYFSCTDQDQKRISLLDNKLANTSILSLSFDSLWQDVQNLPSQQQVKFLFQIAYRNEKDIDGMLKQEKLLLEGLPLASKKQRKKILLRILELYLKLNEEKAIDINLKGIQLIEKLETIYSLSKEEEWTVKKSKAIFLSRRGMQEQYLPIWFELLKEHRATNRVDLVIEDLSAIANQFAILGDHDKSISLYTEAYQLANKYDLPDLSKQCLIRLFHHLYDSNQYREIVNYINRIGIDSLESFTPSVNSILSACYLRLQKPDSSRFYLTKEYNFRKGEGMSLNCLIADTYIAENNTDSALIYLSKAVKIFQNQMINLREQNIKASLPFNFLQSYSSLATLYHKSGKYQQASDAFALVEPLMKKSITNPDQLQKQANALTGYSSFCRTTKQYEKAVDLLVYRDSIQQIINKVNKERDSKNLMDRLQINDLMHRIEMQEASLMNSYRVNVIAFTCAILLFLLICAIAYIYHQRKKQVEIIINQEREKEVELLKTSEIPEEEKLLSTDEKLYRAAYEKVSSKKLYLNKDIRLNSLAETLKTNHAYLSSCINTCAGKNFNQWINDFRIDYLLERIHSGKKLSDLAQEAGFASTDAFYRSFKRKTGLTPSEYLKKYSS